MARDVERYIVNYSDAELKKIGQAARERVLAAHTNEARAIQFETAAEAVLARTEESRTRESKTAGAKS